MYINFPPIDDVVVEGMESVQIPDMITVSQSFDTQCIADAASCIRARMTKAVSHPECFAGKTVAVTVGSRGISHLAEMVRAICDQLTAWDARPFILAAMGSHGGGSIAGQLEILHSYGITEEAMGVPVRAVLDVVQYDTLPDGTPLCCSRDAWEADGIVLFNKVKPHTDFSGPHESGLAKMVAIGLGNHKGSAAIHDVGVERFAEVIPQAAEHFIARRELLLGIGVVQNAYEEICQIEAAFRENIMDMDKQLLTEAKERMGKLKFRRCDILIIDEIGKNISGTGADPNVTGRRTIPMREELSKNLDAATIVILGVSPDSHHNGCGIGLADITTRDCLNGIDWGSTWTNHINSLELSCAHIPCYANDDRQAILLALRALPKTIRDNAKIVHIRSTSQLAAIEVSPALYAEIRDTEGVQQMCGPKPLVFDNTGKLESVL